MEFGLYLILLIGSVQKSSSTVNSICPNNCSRNGLCVESAVGYCQCFPGFIGTDCSLRVCAAGTAWVDFPTASNTAHADFTECSNMVQQSPNNLCLPSLNYSFQGVCDRSTGICKCKSGFGGAACDISIYYLLCVSSQH